MKRLPVILTLLFISSACLPVGFAVADPDLAPEEPVTEESVLSEGETYYRQGEAALKGKDYGNAALFFRKAAVANHAKASEQLGRLYLEGQGVAKDPAEARHWFSRAADAGRIEALYDLGLLYYQGIGVKENLYKAAEYFRRAGDEGYAPAQHLLGIIYAGKSADRQAESVRWFRLAAEQGHAASMNQLGLAYANGDGVAPDLVEAYMWTLLAFEHGSAEAELLLVQLEADLTAEEIDEARQRADGWTSRKAAGDKG